MWLSLPDIDISCAEIIIFFDVVEVFCETSAGRDRGKSQRHKAMNKSQPKVELYKFQGVGKFIVLTFYCGEILTSETRYVDSA